MEKDIKEIYDHTALATGHRPNKLGGCYSFTHPNALLIKNKLIPILEDLIIKNKVFRFISGGAIGFDQIFFWTVQTLKKKYPYIKNIVATPFKNQNAVWKDIEILKWYRKMLKIADEVINVEDIDAYKTEENIPYKTYGVEKMYKRNQYMVDNGRYIITVFDGSKGGTANCLRYAKRSGKEHVLYRLNPKNNYLLEVSQMKG